MSVGMVLSEVESAGVALRISGDRIRIRFTEPQQREILAWQVSFLRAHKDEVAEFLRARERRDRKGGPYHWGRDRDGTPRDRYGWRTHVALDAICRIPAPAGLAVWLEKNASFLYGRLTRDLPNKIDRAWDARIPFKDFDALCFEWESTYRRAAELYRALHEKRKVEVTR
jgi:hypothetical protein